MGWTGAGYFQSLADSLNFTLSLELPRDGKLGSEEEDGQWSGVFRDLIDDVADKCFILSLGPLVDLLLDGGVLHL